MVDGTPETPPSQIMPQKDSAETPQPEPESPEQRMYTRRFIARLGAIATLILGTGVYEGVIANEFYTPYKPEVQTPLEINGRKLIPMIGEHDHKTANQYEALFAEEVRKADVVIPEYFPPEERPQDPFVKEYLQEHKDFYTDSNDEMYRISTQLGEEHKDTWVLDPAYNDAAGILRPALMATVASGETVAYQLLKKIIGADITFSRKDFLRSFLPRVGLAALGTLTSFEAELLVENNMRQVIVAEHLYQIFHSSPPTLPETAQVLLLYPRTHMKGILHYVQDSNARKSRLALYKDVLKPMLPDLFERRHYPQGTTQTVQKQSL